MVSIRIAFQAYSSPVGHMATNEAEPAGLPREAGRGLVLEPGGVYWTDLSRREASAGCQEKEMETPSHTMSSLWDGGQRLRTQLSKETAVYSEGAQGSPAVSLL